MASSNSKVKYVDEGSFGCVFRPAPTPTLYRKRCVGSLAATKDPTVSKFMLDNTDAEIEIANNTSIEQKDPEHVFTVRMIRVCRDVPVKSLKLTPEEVGKCSHIMEAPGVNVTEIVYEDGGSDMDHVLARFVMSPRTANKLLHERNTHLMLTRFEPLFYGIAKMKLSQIIHFDIYPPNVVIQGDRARLIDFGYAQQMDLMVYHPSSFKRLDRNFLHSSPYYPPEFKLAYLIHTHGTEQINFAMYKELLLTLHPAYNTLQRLGVPVETLLKQARVSFHRLLSAEDTIAELMRYDSVIDTFSIGLIMAKLLTKSASVGLPVAADLRALVLRMAHYDPALRMQPDAAYLRYCAIMLRHGAQPRFLGTYVGHAKAVPDPALTDKVVLEKMAGLLDLPRGAGKAELARIISARLGTKKGSTEPKTKPPSS